MNRSDNNTGASICPLQINIPSKLPPTAPSLPETPFPIGQSSPRSRIDSEYKDLLKIESFSPSSSKVVQISCTRCGSSSRTEAPTTPSTALAFETGTGKKKVTWCKRVRKTEIRHINDFTDTEKRAIWMTVEDYESAKAMAKTTVTMIMNGEKFRDDDPDYCARGLEFRTKAGSKARCRNKLRTRSAVLNEQDLQRDEGFFDPEFISMVSMDQSVRCRHGARGRAFNDAKCIKAYLDDVRQVFH
jgi:hypothetical protein